jgi:hypothetical protein
VIFYFQEQTGSIGSSGSATPTHSQGLDAQSIDNGPASNQGIGSVKDSNLADDAVAVNGTNSGNGGGANPESGGCGNAVSDGMGDHKTPDSCGTSGGIGGGNATPTSHCDGSSGVGGGAPPSVPGGSQEDTNGSTPQPQLHSQQQALNSLEADADFLDSFDTKDGVGESNFVIRGVPRGRTVPPPARRTPVESDEAPFSSVVMRAGRVPCVKLLFASLRLPGSLPILEGLSRRTRNPVIASR